MPSPVVVDNKEDKDNKYKKNPPPIFSFVFIDIFFNLGRKRKPRTRRQLKSTSSPKIWIKGGGSIKGFAPPSYIFGKKAPPHLRAPTSFEAEPAI